MVASKNLFSSNGYEAPKDICKRIVLAATVILHVAWMRLAGWYSCWCRRWFRMVADYVIFFSPGIEDESVRW